MNENSEQRSSCSKNVSRKVGVPPLNPRNIDFMQRLSKQTSSAAAWAVYLLKKDTKVELTNDNEGSPPRLDVLEFSNAPIPSLTIQPYWLDLAINHPSPSVGYYSFSSPFISEELDQTDPWTQLVKRLKKQAQWNNGARTQYRRSFSFSNGASLAIEVFAEEDYANDKHGHSVY